MAESPSLAVFQRAPFVAVHAGRVGCASCVSVPQLLGVLLACFVGRRIAVPAVNPRCWLPLRVLVDGVEKSVQRSLRQGLEMVT